MTVPSRKRPLVVTLWQTKGDVKLTVQSSANKSGPYNGNGVTTVFGRDFLILNADHLKVYQTVSGVTSEVTTGITKDGIGSVSGNVTFDTAPATGTKITLLREVPLTQETDYSTQGKVSTDQVERDLDLQVMQVQDLNERIERSIKVPITDTGGDGAVIDVEPGQFVRRKVDDSGFEGTDLSVESVDVDAWFQQRSAASASQLAALSDGSFGYAAGLPYHRDVGATGASSAFNRLGVDGVRPFSHPDLGHFGAAPALVRGVDTAKELTGSYFGMNGNTTINTNALLDAAAYLTATKGGLLTIGEGNFSFDSEIVFPANTFLSLSPKTVLEFGGGLNDVAFSWAGSSGDAVAVTVDVFKGALLVAVAPGDEADFVVGEFAKLTSTEVFDAARTDTKKGELLRVRAVTSGFVSFWEPVRDSYMLASGTVTIKPVTMAGRCGIEGGSLIGTNEAASNELFGLQFRFCERPVVRGTDLGRFDERATYFLDCDHPYIGHLKSFDSVTDGTGYLVSFANATRGGLAEFITGINQRHMTSTNNESVEGGVVRDVTFRDMHCAWTSTALAGSMSPGDMYDTHAAADGVTFERCISMASQSAAFNVECANVHIKDCVAHNPMGRAISAVNYSDMSSTIHIENFTATAVGEEAIFISGGQTSGSDTSAFHDIVKIDCVDAVAFSGNTDIAVHIETDSGRMSHVRTDNMKLTGFSGADVVRVDNSEIWEFKGNSGSSNTGDFYRAFDVDHVIGELGTPQIATSQSVLYVDNAVTSVRVLGGRPTQTGGAKGITTEAGSVDVIVKNTDFSAITQNYDFGTGTTFETDDRNERMADLIIAAGVVTGVRPHTQTILLDTQGSASTDNLWEIDDTEAYDGQVIVIVSTNSGRDIVIKDAGGGSPEGTPNIRLNSSSDRTLNDNTDTLTLQYRGGVWREVSYSDN